VIYFVIILTNRYIRFNCYFPQQLLLNFAYNTQMEMDKRVRHDNDSDYTGPGIKSMLETC